MALNETVRSGKSGHNDHPTRDHLACDGSAQSDVTGQRVSPPASSNSILLGDRRCRLSDEVTESAASVSLHLKIF